ncbi:MAG TPA: DUF1127 domain-containing protein, partial [Stellaceae bacterium]
PSHPAAMEIRSFTMISVAREPVAARVRRDRRPQAAASEGLIARIARIVAAWHRRARDREQLARLSERELRDIGMTPGDAAWECAKPFWRG